MSSANSELDVCGWGGIVDTDRCSRWICESQEDGAEKPNQENTRPG
jgi:hypothetical protein